MISIRGRCQRARTTLTISIRGMCQRAKRQNRSAPGHGAHLDGGRGGRRWPVGVGGGGRRVREGPHAVGRDLGSVGLVGQLGWV